MAGKKSHKKIIIIIIIVIILLGVGAAAYFAVTNGFFAAKETETTNTTNTKPAYVDNLEKTQTKVADLIASGDAASIKQADELVDAEVSKANESGDNGYIVYSNLAKASLLRETGRAQEALDDVLKSIDTTYSTDDSYKSDIYVNLSQTYSALGDNEKADEYLIAAGGRGGN